MNHRQVANKALELADKLLQNNLVSWGKCTPEDHDTAVWTNEQAAQMLRSQEKYINLLHKLLNANGIGSGRNLLTGEIIPFEVEE